MDKHLVNERAEPWLALRRKPSLAIGRDRLKGVLGPLDVERKP